MVDYLDCELSLAGLASARLSVGEKRYAGRTRFDETLERELLEALNECDFVRYGEALFSALFATELRDGYRAGLEIAERENKRLRLRLNPAAAGDDAARLHRLRWEYLYDPASRCALGRSRQTVFSRYLDVASTPPPPVTGPLHLLIVLAAPRDLEEWGLEPLDRDAMRRSLERSLEPLQGQVTCELLEPPATLSRISDRLVARHTPHALLIQGHGLLIEGSAAGLALEDDEGRLKVVDEDVFSDVFEGLRELRLVILSACHSAAPSTDRPYSGLGPALVRRGIPAVVAMQQSISVDSAALFLEHFFRNLQRTGLVDAAANEARMQLYTADSASWAWGLPVLFMRLKDARLWQARSATKKTADDRDLAWESILERLANHQLTPVLGPGVVDGVFASPQEIALAWAEEFGFPWDGSDRENLPNVSWYAETQLRTPALLHDRLPKVLLRSFLARGEISGYDGYEDRVKPALSRALDELAESYFSSKPDEAHRILSELPIACYVTTNVDNLMTAALRWRKSKKPRRVTCAWREGDFPADSDHLEGSVEEPLVFHLYGSDEKPDSIVLTLDDHLDFLHEIAAGKVRIPKAALTSSMLLFLGYKIKDLDCRVLFRGLIMPLRNTRGRRAVLQLSEKEKKNEAALRTFFDKCCKGIDIDVIWTEAVGDFLVELRDRWEARRHGQRRA
ncbi:MAG TPA: CHAT domain-containing protein [Thermoanaerobaculia bacterium]|jgi:hypothetical protein